MSKEPLSDSTPTLCSRVSNEQGKGTEGEDEDEASFLVDWDGPDDPANPRNFPSKRKWAITLITTSFCGMVSLCVTSYSISLISVESELMTSETNAFLGITLFTITFGTAPLLLAPLSETYGRSIIFIISAFVFCIFFIPQAVARNIETILVSRFISGIAGSSAVSLVGGTLSDLFDNENRGLPMSIFAFMAFATTGAGPVMFSYMALIYGYRAIMWVMFASSFVFAGLLTWIIEETRANVLLKRKAKKMRLSTGDSRYREKDDSVPTTLGESLSRPVRMLIFEPVLTAFTIWISFTWGVLYILLSSIPIIFSQLYGFDTGQSGLVFITSIVGCFIGVAIDYYCNRAYHKMVATKGTEARLYTAMAGGFLLPFGGWIYAWTSFPNVHFIAPCIGITLLYAGMYLIYVAVFQYLADAYGFYASSALSAQSFVRNCVGAVFPLVVRPMYGSLGIQGAGSLTAGISTLLSLTPFVLYRYGAYLRANSPFAKQLALHQATLDKEADQKNAGVSSNGERERKEKELEIDLERQEDKEIIVS